MIAINEKHSIIVTREHHRRASYKPTLYIIYDDSKTLDSLGWLAGNNGIKTKIYSCANDFLEAFKPGLKGCVLSDMNLPEIDGIELHNRLETLDAHLPVILTSGNGNIPLAVEAIKNGVIDFIEKPTSSITLLAAIRKAFAVNQEYHEGLQHTQELQAPLKRLSKRERDVFDLVVQGFSSKAIGNKLTICQKTVETHRAKIMKKINANSLADLIALNNNAQ